jgi:Domain of unknown function (DUF6702)
MTVIFLMISLFSPGMFTADAAHAIYVSVLEVEQEAGTKQGTIRVKVFANDLEDAIFNQSKNRIALQNGDCGQNKSFIGGYFKEHLHLNIDGTPIKYRYVSCEINDISIWLTFEFISPPAWSKVDITADYLIELFPTQSNVVSVTYRNEKRMFRLTKGSTTETVSF